ncbi:MAG: pirin-like C-terminal cupin domain-containing protein, partial [Parahaliea sp.]
WDLRLSQGSYSALTQPEGWTTALVVLHGAVQVNGNAVVREGQLVVLDRDGEQFSIEANSDAVLLLLGGQPIEEPIVGHGPFVMNSHQEIVQAIEDFNKGRFGAVPA